MYFIYTKLGPCSNKTFFQRTVHIMINCIETKVVRFMNNTSYHSQLNIFIPPFLTYLEIIIIAFFTAVALMEPLFVFRNSTSKSPLVVISSVNTDPSVTIIHWITFPSPSYIIWKNSIHNLLYSENFDNNFLFVQHRWKFSYYILPISTCRKSIHYFWSIDGEWTYDIVISYCSLTGIKSID